VLDENDCLLLCRFDLREPPGAVVWATPGGGVEPGETPMAALRRELKEEIGLTVLDDPPHVWHQVVVAPGRVSGHDGAINDFFLVRTTRFSPAGELSEEELAAENIGAFRWWHPEEIDRYDGTALFAPRDLATPLKALLTSGVPPVPVRLDL
jgi:8-oxo-dGTP diphosphatase